MSSVKRITALADDISKNSKIVTDYLSEKNLEAASFDVDGLAAFPIDPNDEVAFRARLDLIAATKELHDLTLGPKEGLRYLAWDVSSKVLCPSESHLTDNSKSINQLSLQAMHEFKVAEAVPLEGSISYQELADKVDVPMLNLRRLVRHAMTNHIFHEPVKGFVAHTRTSRLLIEDEPLRNWVGFMTNDIWLPIAQVVQAMKKWPGSGESNETSVNLAYDTDMNWFDWIQQDKELAKRYGLAMQAHGGGEGFAITHTVDGYPWESLGKATVVDVRCPFFTCVHY